jgi:NAD(P)-dependent dehydrogenase (short-subunit alcohol dehydrogenase family)
MAELDGKVAIVTGGGRGIGRTHALALATQGAAVVVNDLGNALSGDGAADGGPADEVVALIRAAGGRAVADASDVSDWEAAASLVQRAVDEFGGLDIVVNNAGISRLAPTQAISRADWELTISVALTGTAAVVAAASRYWAEQGPAAGRRIINTTSGVGLSPQPDNPMYAAAKAGVAALTVAASIDLAKLGVRVNAIAPIARTRISESIFGELMGPAPEGMFDRMAPENVSTLVTYLASDRCRFTGQVLGVIGDDVLVFRPWSAEFAIDNDEEAWTFDGLAAALEEAPLQQVAQTQFIKSSIPGLTPSDEVLEQLTAAESA